MPLSPRVKQLLDRLTLHQKAGQCFTFGFSGGVLNPNVIRMVRDLHAGGLRYTPNYHASFAKYKKVGAPEPSEENTDTNDEERQTDVMPPLSPNLSPAALVGVLNELQTIAAQRPVGVPLHLSFDSEGGVSGDILRGGYPMFPAMMGLAAADDDGLVTRVARAIARLHRASGMHFMHSPVLDVNVDPRNPEINVRAFGDTVEKVSRLGRAFLRGLTEGGIAATAKHFPGRGDSAVDAHYELPVCPADADAMQNIHLAPYRDLIREGLPAIMLAHTLYPGLGDDKLPATVSKRIVQGVIRDELGFDGVVTTDSITMEGILKIYPAEEASARAIEAGVDLVLFKNEDLDLCRQAVDTVVRFVEEGTIPAERLDASVARILTLKERFGLLDTEGRVDPAAVRGTIDDAAINALATEAAGRATLLLRDRKGALPIARSAKVLVVEQSMFLDRFCNDEYFHPYSFWKILRGVCPEADLVRLGFTGASADLEEAAARAREADVVVATNWYNRGAAPNTPFVEKLIAATDRPVAVVTNTPYELSATEAMDCVLCVFSEFVPSLRAAARILYGDAEALGTVPVERLG